MRDERNPDEYARRGGASAARKRHVYTYRYGVAVYGFGWTFSIGFDRLADCWWWPLWIAKGYHGDVATW